jgi:hypothetical protein
VGVQWESGGSPVGIGWEAAGRPMGGRWEANGRPLGGRWESAGSPSLAQLIAVIAIEFSDGDVSYFLWEFLCHISCK